MIGWPDIFAAAAPIAIVAAIIGCFWMLEPDR
jgi:hypothetical protein